MKQKLIYSLPLWALASMSVLNSCQDLDWGYTADEIKYKTNFEKIYGEIPADKSWDLSSWANWQPIVPNDGTRSISDGHATKGELAEGTHYSIGENWYTVPQGLLSWLDNQLVEGNDNRYLGSSFVLKVPANDFAIIPIYQGNSAIMSELELKINDYDITKIWTKSENIQGDLGSGYQPCGYFDGYPHYDFIDRTPVEVASDASIYDYENDGKRYVYKPNPTMHPASTIEDYAVQAKPIIFHHNQIETTPGQEFMYLSLRNIAKSLTPKGNVGHFGIGTDGKEHWVVDQYKLDNAKNTFVTEMWDINNQWTTVGDRLTSINSNGYMLALNVPWDKRPSADALATLLPGYDKATKGAPQALIVGCEDANGAGSDHDVNDIVFLIVGYPNVPTVVPTTEVIKKRYMCEDLGATDDFDFNDIVVDVTQTMDYELAYQPTSANIDGFFNNTVDPSAVGQVEITNVTPMNDTKVQTAKISHVCGTLPIQVQVGNYLFPWINDPTDLPRTREDLRAGGWKYNGSSWVESEVKTPTRAAYEVKEEGWNPNEERIITGWNPQQNNITVYVQWPNDWKQPHSDKTNPTNDKDELTGSNPYGSNNKADFIDFIQGDRRVENVTFPKPGTVPYIIAMDPDVPWMKERKDIIKSWLTNGEWEASSEYYKENVAGPGSGAYYENDPDRAIIWTGKVGGEAYVTGVVCAKGSSEQLGAAEAIESDYNTINIYTHPFNDLNERGYVGLSYIDSKGEWQTLTADDAEGYLDDADVMVGSDKTTKWHCANIRLTPEQMTAIKNNGFVVQSRTNALVIREINLTKTEGYTVQLNAPALDATNHNSVMGVITAKDRRRDLSKAEDAGRIPFAKASYSTNETCVLTAEPTTGHAFVRWSDGNTDNPREVTDNLGPITAEFAFSLPAAEIDLAGKFHRWSSYQSGAHISSPNGFGGYTPDALFGDASVAGENYADLTSSDVLVVNCSEGVNLRLVFNRQSLDGNGSEFFAFTTDSDKDYTITHLNGNGTKYILINLKAIREAKGYAHLNKMEKRGTGEITSMKLDKYDNTSAENAFTQLQTDWTTANNGIDLTDAMFYEWTSVDNNARVRGTGGRTNKVHIADNKADIEVKPNGQYCETILGSTYNNVNEYANLSSARWLLVKTNCYTGVPRFWFNGKAIDFLGTDTRYCRIYKGTYGGNHEYLVDLEAVRTANGGKSLLNAITTPEGHTSCWVSAVKVSGYSKPASITAWEDTKTTVEALSWPVEFKSTTDAAGNHPTSPDYTVEGGWPWGNATHNDNYVDLSSANWMRITLPSDAYARKDLRLSFNAVSDNNRLLLDKNSEYVFIYGEYWYVNLAKIKEDKGKVEFHAIGGPNYGENAKINRIEFDQYAAAAPATLYAVGINIQVKKYGQSAYALSDEVGKTNITTTASTFYKKNGDGTYTSLGTNSVDVNSGSSNYVYVEQGADITFSLPKNADFKFKDGQSNYNSDLKRTVNNVHDNTTPYPQYDEKAPANATVTDESGNVVTSIDLGSFTIHYSSEIKNFPSITLPDYVEQVGETVVGSSYVTYQFRGTKTGSGKKIVFTQEANETYKKSVVEIDATTSYPYTTDLGYKLPLASTDRFSLSETNDKWYNAWTDNVKSIIKYVDGNYTKGAKMSVHIPNTGLMKFYIGTNHGSGQKTLLYQDGVQNGASWDGSPRILSYTMSKNDFNAWFNSVGGIYFGGDFNDEGIELFIEPVD